MRPKPSVGGGSDGWERWVGSDGGGGEQERDFPSPCATYAATAHAPAERLRLPGAGNPQMECDDAPGLMMLTTDHALVSDPKLKV